LTEAESLLLRGLVKDHPDHHRLLAQIDQAQVVSLADGDMGSLRFVSTRAERALGHLAAEVTFTDIDGVEGSIQVNLDDVGDLFEVDIWKVDFSPLREIPQPGRCTQVQAGA
jgi:hypothetical protein